MKLTSLSFLNDEVIASRFTCDGEPPTGGINPPLVFSAVPKEAKSLALILSDPDAPNGTFIHWVLWNIPPKTKEIGEGMLPVGAVEGTNGTGKTGYVGLCPPAGTHHYFFKLYALDVILNLPTTAKADGLEKAMAGHIIEEAQLVGLYSRAK